jgi:hypothetical protein
MNLALIASRARHAAATVGLFLSSMFVSVPAIAQERDVPPGEVKVAMYELLRTVERAGMLGSSASERFWNSDPGIFTGWSQGSKVKFVEAVKVIRAQSEAAMSRPRMPLAAPQALAVSAFGSVPFEPNYPSTSTTLDYDIILGLGWVAGPTERPHGDAYDYYVLAMTTAKEELDILSLACTVAGCDPTGIVCAGVCGGVNATMAAYMLASVPLRAANRWSAAIDQAELQAAYRNAVLVLADLSAHDAHLGRNHSEIKQLLSDMFTTLTANQQQIIKLLLTPDGRRPGWGKAGY